MEPQSLDGLAAAHFKGIIHRDLKPENIFLPTMGESKFSTSVWRPEIRRCQCRPMARRHSFRPQQECRRLWGPLGILSPERVRGEKAGATSDIFSLGCVLYEMATGKRAFQHQTSSGTLDAILKDEPSEPSAFNKTVPRKLGLVILRCLEKEPAARYQCARVLSEDLEGLLISLADEGAF